jgi:hypothetical protein
LRASSGIFSGPKTTSATIKITIRCGMLSIQDSAAISPAVFAS